MPPPLQVFLMSEGITVSTALTLAAELGVADLLAGGPRHHQELAHRTDTHPRSLNRLLRLLSSVGVFTEVESGTFGLTALGDCLRAGTTGSMKSWLRMVGPKAWFHTFADALHSVRTGEPAFRRAMGSELFEYLGAHPAEADVFNAAMSDFGQSVAASVMHAYDFSGLRRIIDVGGGNGSFAAAILAAHPHLVGTILDQPHAAPAARQLLAETGLSQRCEFVEGDFFHSVPAGGDACILRWIIHDWDDERARVILRNCRAALPSTGRLLLVEAVVPPGDEAHPSKLMDFVMLVGLGGCERTREEYVHLLESSGFRLNGVTRTDSPMSIIEALANQEYETETNGLDRSHRVDCDGLRDIKKHRPRTQQRTPAPRPRRGVKPGQSGVGG